MNREALVKVGIQNLEGNDFERFSYVLLSRDLYPGLNPTSQSGDLGEDARTEPSTLFLHHGKWISLATSKEHGWGKVKKDCDRCKETGRRIDILVFVTAGNPRTTTIDRWKKDVKKIYRWDLEVKAINFLAPHANRPEYEDIADQYLKVPPLGGDFIQEIEAKFYKITQRFTRSILTLIPGTDTPIERDEIKEIEDHIRAGQAVILIGEAGSGKSGIAYQLTVAVNPGKPVLFLDARRLAHVKNDTDLRNYTGLNGSIDNAIRRLASDKGCRLIIDQLDNSIGLPIADVLIDLALDLQNQDGVEIILVSRKRESKEINLLDELIANGFDEIESRALSSETVKEILEKLGVISPNSTLVEIGKNLLNLEIIGRIIQSKLTFEIDELSGEIDLWESYIETIQRREPEIGVHIIDEAINLAKKGIIQENRTFTLDFARSREQNRLVSWRIIVSDNRRVFRFHHEKLQDFLCAFDVFERELSQQEIMNELGDSHRSRNILIMLQEIYHRNDPEQISNYLKEAWNVK